MGLVKLIIQDKEFILNDSNDIFIHYYRRL